MKQVTQNSIINIDENKFDNKFLFIIPLEATFENEVDLATLLSSSKNPNLDYKKDYKLWSEVYSPKDELRIFTEVFEDAIKNDKKIHISNISLSEEIEMVKDLYLELGYFNKELNRFEIDFNDSPITIWVSMNNIIYSFKDYKQLKEKILFVPPPREPKHQKSIRSAINSWIISTISLNNPSGDKIHIESMIKEEKTSLVRLASMLYYNFKNRGFEVKAWELTILVK
ncbi:MAG: hypothetical protein ACD_3C00067G0017 [uncultured bacterium (gcode 4)]|uniref:Uncharacterized protein n=1 Tax=uncultured bacterium (gcode 4) TaxID=1234023 RepID=K2FZH4_9BACT|nr:MAG: hypothetical protein ACD_3C00067G0017 [uncultured bacterium (gcode 4)]